MTLCPSGGKGGFLHFAFVCRAMGDSLIHFTKLSDVEIVEVIKSASAELHKRLQGVPQSPRAGSTGSFERVGYSPGEPSQSTGLKKPWSCGFEYRWCKAACTRQQGHKNHSCFEHRHRR